MSLPADRLSEQRLAELRDGWALVGKLQDGIQASLMMATIPLGIYPHRVLNFTNSLILFIAFTALERVSELLSMLDFSRAGLGNSRCGWKRAEAPSRGWITKLWTGLARTATALPTGVPFSPQLRLWSTFRPLRLSWLVGGSSRAPLSSRTFEDGAVPSGPPLLASGPSTLLISPSDHTPQNRGFPDLRPATGDGQVGNNECGAIPCPLSKSTENALRDGSTAICPGP